MLWKIGLVLLCWGLAHGKLQETEPISSPATGNLDFGFVPAGVYDTVAYYEPGPIGILFNMMHAFLQVVQPNQFPKDLVVRLAKDKFRSIQSEYQKPENVVLTLQVIYYEIGFVVCAALGLLFAVLLPLVGLFFCMCRCCDNCGGEMHQRQRKNADCQRGLLTTLLLTTTFIITAGVLCAYAASQNLSSELKTMRRLVNSNLRDLYTFVNVTPVQIDYLIAQYGTAKNQVLWDLDNVGLLLGGRIHEELGKEVRPALDGVLHMAGVMRDTREALENVSVSLGVLQEGTAQLQFNLSVVRTSLRNMLDDPACANAFLPTPPLCHNIRDSLGQLDISTNYSRPPNVTRQLVKVNDVLKTDLNRFVQKGLSAFNNTPAMVTEQTTKEAAGVRGLLDGIGSNITSFSRLFPIQSSLNNLTISISHMHSSIEDLYPEIDLLDFYRWVGCVTLCCLVVLILAFNFLGLLCGILGYDRHASPTTRGCVSNTGGNLLMAGVGFSFLFSWVLMGVVTATFVLGGNVEKLMCEPFHSRQLFKVLDTPYLVNPEWRNFIPGYLYHDPDVDLTAENLYSNCKKNRGIYLTLHLDRIFNILPLLNTSRYTKDVSHKFEGMKIDLRSIILLDSEGKQNLLSFTETGIEEINFAAYLEEINKGVTHIDLLSFSNDLDTEAHNMDEGSLKTSVMDHTRTLHQIYTKQVIPIQQFMDTLNQSIRFLERTASDLQNKVSDVLTAIDAAQFLVSQNATFVVNQETEKYMQTIISYFQQYIDWVKTSLEMDVATCKPLSNIVDTAEILACSFLMDSMNTFWFGLGCSTLFLLPSIILSVRLAKFYRRMDTEDVYDDIETIPMKTLPTYDTTNRFPRASAPPRHADW
ncbi:prominin-1-A isoform X1 [Electrophorus electricus]|uniref:prominin-1-A isoform X1 n=1 Tax=Electrophorus electricus TaxID=8005 RepID=UPI0015CF993A|nr:prominin-1-A isoform X1 [Electrophorus electricus]